MEKITGRQLVESVMPESATEYDKFLLLNSTLIRCGFHETYDLDWELDEDFLLYSLASSSLNEYLKRNGLDPVFPVSAQKINNEYMVSIMHLSKVGIAFLIGISGPVSFIDENEEVVHLIFKDHKKGNSYISPSYLDSQVFDKSNLEKTYPRALSRLRRDYKSYLMFDHATGYYKIGKSIDPKIRERTLQSEKPTIELLGVGAMDVESRLHRLFKDKRVRGEWFGLNKEDVESIINMFQQ